MAEVAEVRSTVGAVALRLYAERGIAGTTVADVLAEAGLAPHDLTPPITSEDDLLVAATEVFLAEHMRVVEGALRDVSNVGEAFGQIVDAMVTRIGGAEDVEYQRLMLQLWNASLHDERIERLLIEMAEQPRHVLAEGFARGQQEGTVRADLDPIAVFDFMLCVWYGMIVQRQTDPGFDAGRMLQTAVQVYNGGIFVGGADQD